MERRTKLKPKRVKFIQEYLKDFDGTNAAIRAGYSEHSARFIASRLLINPEVKKELDRRQAEIAKKYEIRTDFIVQTLMDLIADCKVDEDRHHLIKSLDMLNKMGGKYSHTVVNQTPDQPLFPD